MKGYYDKPCQCGSGKLRFPLHDARGIFCGYVCDKCEATVKARYRPEIFAEGTRPDGSDECSNPTGHSWVEGEPARGDEGPIRCRFCGADGDA
jgi:hypothetical protein